jgi:hypothetical protein
MSNQFQFINENEISHLFQSYLQEMNVGIAFDQIIDDVLDEEFSEAETLYVVHEILMPEVVKDVGRLRSCLEWNRQNRLG